MNGIDKITERILRKAEDERERILSEASAEAESVYSDLKTQADLESADIVNRGREQAKRYIDRAKSASGRETSQMLLETKQLMIDRAFDHTKKLLIGLSDEEYTNLVASLASKALISGNEQLIVGKSDSPERVNLLKVKVNQRAAARGLATEVTVLPEAGNFEGGVIVRRGNIETNCTFDTINRALRDSISGEVASALFEQENANGTT